MTLLVQAESNSGLVDRLAACPGAAAPVVSRETCACMEAFVLVAAKRGDVSRMHQGDREGDVCSQPQALGDQEALQLAATVGYGDEIAEEVDACAGVDRCADFFDVKWPLGHPGHGQHRTGGGV